MYLKKQHQIYRKLLETLQFSISERLFSKFKILDKLVSNKLLQNLMKAVENLFFLKLEQPKSVF